MHSIKAIFFDLDNTLVDCETADRRIYEIVAALAREKVLNINTCQLINCFKEQLLKVPFDPDGQMNYYPWRISLWEKALCEQGINHSKLAEQLNDLFHLDRMAFYQFLPGVKKMLTELLDHYIGVIITNGDSGIQRPKLKACHAENYFDHIIVGGEEPFEKPHPSIFYKACDLAKCSPEDAIIVGDSLNTDILGGLNSGLASTIWVNPKNKKIPENGPFPNDQIVSALELPFIMKQF